MNDSSGRHFSPAIVQDPLQIPLLEGLVQLGGSTM